MHVDAHNSPKSIGAKESPATAESRKHLPEDQSERVVGASGRFDQRDETESPSPDEHQAAPPKLAMLTQEQLIGLSPWFTNPGKDDQIDRLLRAGFLATWTSRVDNRLMSVESFQPDSGRPKSWHGLGKAIGKNGQGFTRYPRSGSVVDADRKPPVPDLSVRYLVAWALQTPETELAPDTAQWISESARFLVLHFKADSENRLPKIAYRVYGCYLSMHFGRHDTCLDRTTTLQIDKQGFERLEDVEQAIGDVANAVGSSILSNDIIGSFEWE